MRGWQSSQMPRRLPPQSVWLSVARQPEQKCSPIMQYGHSECVNSLGIAKLRCIQVFQCCFDCRRSWQGCAEGINYCEDGFAYFAEILLK